MIEHAKGRETMGTGSGMKLMFVCFAVAALALPLGGCLVVKDSNQSITGKGISPPSGTLAQVEPGKTTKSQIMAMLGDPSSSQKVNDEEMLYRWDYGSNVNEETNVFLLLHNRENKSTATSVYAMVKDGVVQKCWTDTTK
jgi:outer membrane protein assembly factor BamE (lipoprotein component of BamABCDE complex)